MKTINLAAGTTHVRYDELAALIACALWPDDGSMDVELWAVSMGGAQMNLDVELKQAVTMRRLPVKDPLTFGPHTFPVGHALKSAQVTIDDLRAYVADRGITVVVGDAPEQADTQPQAGNDAPVVDVPDPKRRLAALRTLGGSYKFKRGRDGVQAWLFTGIQKLVAQEKADERKRSDEKTIRDDLREAAETESMEKRNAWNK